MTTGVWVLVPPDAANLRRDPEVQLIRGDEIIEVHYRDVGSAQYPRHVDGRPVERGQVSVVQARTPHADGGTSPHRIVLWYTPDAATAAAASLRLITLLGSSEGDGVVLYSRDDHKVRLVRFDELDSADLTIATVTVPDGAAAG